MTENVIQPGIGPSKVSLQQRLFNPFKYVAGGKALGWGLAAILLAGGIGSISNTHFDGVLDTHTGAAAPLLLFFVAGIADWLSLALVLFAIGLVASKSSFRTIDLFGTQALARWPTIFTALFCLLPGYHQITSYLAWKYGGIGSEVVVSPVAYFQYGIVVLVMLLVIVWMVMLMFQSFRISCNLKGGKAVVLFIVGMLIGEGISKVGFYILMKLFSNVG